MVKVRPLGHVEEQLWPAILAALDDGLAGAAPTRCMLGPATRRIGGDWLGAPVSGLDELAARVFAVTASLVAVTHPQPFSADIVLARGRVPAELAGQPVSGSWTADALALVADRSPPRMFRIEEVGAIRLRRSAPARIDALGGSGC